MYSSSGPFVHALGQILKILKLCSRHIDVVQLLVSNPAALDNLSKHPEKALAALTKLDAVEDVDDDAEVPYGLNSMGIANMLARVQHLKALDIAYEPHDTLYAQNVLNRTLSGVMVRTRIVCNTENAQKTGCSTLLMMRGPHQPYLSDAPGALGVFLSPMTRLADWPVFENVLVSQTRDTKHNVHADNWLYAGRYELMDSRPLTAEYIALLSEETLGYWAYHFHRVKGAQLDRLRARVYLSVVDRMKTVTEADLSRYVLEHDSGIVISAFRQSDLRDALKDGSIAQKACATRPVGYDVGIPMLLEQTRERMQAEQEAEDDDIEIISGPTRGTKRKTPPASIESPRPRPVPSTQKPCYDNGPRMPRPKRSTASSVVNYREYDSDGDFERAGRSTGPSPSGSQPRQVVQ